MAEIPENRFFKPSLRGMIPTALGLLVFFLWVGLGLILLAPVVGLFILLLIAIILFFVYLSIKVTSYEARSDGLFIKRGLVRKKQILLLYTQIQDVTEYQDFWSRIVGLKALQIETMTTTSAIAGRLTNLLSADADLLKGIILEAIHGRTKHAAQGSRMAESIHADLNVAQDDSKSNPYPLHYTRMAAIWLVLCLIAVIVILSVFFFAGTPSDWLSNVVIWVIIIISVPIGLFIQQATFKYWLSAHGVTIKSGWLSTQKTSMEYGKIQDFILSYGVFARMLGIASVRFETGAVAIMQGGRNNRQRPNYIVPTLLLEDARKVSSFIIGKLGIKYVPNKVPLVEQVPLSKKKPVKKTLWVGVSLFILFLIISAVILVSGAVSSGSFGDAHSLVIIMWIAIVCLILVIINFIYQVFYLKYYYYDWSHDTLTIRKGVIGKNQIYLPFEKVQNIFMDQDLFDRMFGLYDVHLSTVGQASPGMCHIDGLEKQNADRLVKALLQQVKKNIQK